MLQLSKVRSPSSKIIAIPPASLGVLNARHLQVIQKCYAETLKKPLAILCKASFIQDHRQQ